MERGKKKLLASYEIRREAKKKLLQNYTKQDLPEKKEDLLKLVEELKIHQIELEMLNEKLKTSRDELERDVNNFKDLYDSAPVGYLTLDKNANIVQSNLKAAKMLGAVRSKLFNKSFLHFVVDDNKNEFNDLLNNVCIKNLSSHREIKLVKGNGEQFYARIDAIPDHEINICKISITNISQQKTTELNLKESILQEHQMAEIVKKAPIGIAFGYPDGRMEQCNKAFVNITGYKLEELKNISWNTELTPKKWLEKELKILDTLSPSNTTVTYEKEYIHKNGTIIPIELKVIAKYDNNDKVLHYIGFVQDITERKKSHEKLIENEKLLSFAQKLGKIGSWNWDISNNTLIWSEELYKIWEWNHDEQFTFEAISSRIHPEDQSLNNEQVSEIIAKKDKGSFEFRIIMNDKRIKYIHQTMEVLRNKAGEAIRIIGSMQDITEHKIIEKKLFESRELYKSIYKNSGAAISYFTIEGNVIEFNDIALSNMNKKPEEIVGKNLKDLFPKKEAAKYLKRLYNCVEKNKSIEYEDYINLPGVNKWLITVISPIKDKLHKITGVQFLSIDISEKKKAELLLIKSEEKYKSFFNNDISGNYVSTKEGKLLDCNKAFIKMMGYNSINEIRKVNTVNFYPDPNNRKELLKDLYEYKHLENYNIRLIKKDGSILYGIENIIANFNNEGNLEYFQGYLTDITEKYLTEKALAENEFKYKVVVENFNGGIIVFQDLKRVYYNLKWLEIIGYNSEEYSKINFLDVLATKDKDYVTNIFNEINDGIINEKSFEFEIISKTGKKLFFNAEISKFNWIDKPSVMLILNEITLRKEAEIKLNESEEKFSKAFYYHPVPMVIVDLESQKRIEANYSYLKLTGFTSEEALLTNTDSTDLWTDYQHYQKALIKLKKEGSLNDFPMSIKTKSGEIKDLLVYSTLFEVENKRFSITSIIDVTQRKVDEDKLRENFKEITELKKIIEAENVYLREEINLEHNYGEIVGNSKVLKKMLTEIESVSKSSTTVLILGETGTGKELVAHAIHQNSDRKDKPLIKVNCAAMPSALIESELFGHEKGAFTGAVKQRIGRFELANNGTIFLDEIGDISIELQSKLLRFLQEGEYERIGSSKTRKIDVRVIAATNRNLEKAVIEGKFRQDLYYRLNVYPVQVPALRERKNDIQQLAEFFINKFNVRFNKKLKSISKASYNALLDYYWPGNIRELENIIERGVLRSTGEVLHLEDWFVKEEFKSNHSNNTKLDVIEKEHILSVLKSTKWKIRGANGAANILGLKPTTLEARMKKLGIQRPI